ncbi:Epimerase [Pararobbsia alpina]|uniref:NAD-dependent epimerase/dehydratase family protein n=1 Tax=Pararobbsia alpina TaxID=621374 RepID=UPI0039A4DACD
MKVFVTGAAGYIGSSIATHLKHTGHEVTGLVRSDEQAAALRELGITPVVGTLDDRALLIAQTSAADGVVNAASSDHRGAVEALIEGLKGSGKPLLHTSGSSLVGDNSKGEGTDAVYHEDTLPAPTPDKAARVAIDALVLGAAEQGVRSAVLCNTLIYGHSLGLPRESVQLPRLIRQAKKSGVMRHVGRGRNIWSNVHIRDVVELYRLALEGTPAGMFYFVENGEASFAEMANALAHQLGLDASHDWPIEAAIEEWGYEMASYGLGSNSRVRGERARRLLGWKPEAPDVLNWIKTDIR